jgi:hypothetical protein
LSKLLLRRQQKRTYAAAVLWQPIDLGTQLKAWWNADDLADGAVTTWTDRIAGLAPTQATPGFRPVRAATDFNSAYAGVTFDGTDDRLAGSSTGSMPVGTTASEIYAVAAQNEAGTTGGTRNIFTYGGGGPNGSRQIARQPVTSVNRLRAYDSTGGVLDTVKDFSGSHIVSVRFDTGITYLFFDGVASTPASAASAFNSLATNTTIGAAVTGTTQLWKGVIRHIFVTTTLATGDRQKLEGWMAWNVALASLLPAGHPYKSAPPS